MSQTVAFPIKARLLWRLIFDYDNSGNEGSIEHKYTFTESGSYTSTEFNESVASHAKKLHEEDKIDVQVGASYGPVSASVGAGHSSSKEIDDMLQNTIRTQQETSITYTRTEEHTVGPHSRLCLYQRNFKGPGMSVAETTFRTTSIPLTNDELEEEVVVDLVLVPKNFVKRIKVVYGDRETQAPANRIREFWGGSDDVNYNMGGKYVWLVAETTTQVAEAINRVDLVITSDKDYRYDDLAKGAHGKFRYLIPVQLPGDNLCITSLRLLRGKYVGVVGSNHTKDINEGRGGDYLFLSWELERAYPI
ncbi:hypothetical protein H0H92_002772 [Tricholoma furcatifolium]|nr:hypothetical protein H0H92_002772 [Tricholoma furcatifolium]